MSSILKCKMCGGDIEVGQDMTVGKCLFCGSTMTLPRIDSDKKARLFNRANEYRLNNEFDKAYDAYKTITEEDEQEAEAYWGMILSEYGVEYVEDPNSGKRIPTCHRTQVTNIQNTTNYKMALRYADSERKFMYQDEAEEIDKLQRDILAVSSKEEGYDVFICYKESEENGDRTQDSVLAQDIYNELNRNGIRTFFSRISLEDHLGENYEPYIYSALSSAKIMIVVSTKREHCEAVWVKNEWARFIGFMNEDPSKTIIPVYKEMSPYEFPPELSKYQAQNMEKVGAIQDLVHGVTKLTGQGKNGANEAVVKQLVLESKQRQESKLKVKKYLIIAAITAACLFAIAGVGIIGVKIRGNAFTKQIEKQSITVSEGLPSSDEYLKLTLEVTPENFDDYFELVPYDIDENAGYYLKSKIYDEGWIFLESSGVSVGGFDSPDGSEAYVSFTSDPSSNNPIFYTFGTVKNINTTNFGVKFNGFDDGRSMHITYVSKRAVKTNKFETESKELYRVLELKGGSYSNKMHIKRVPESVVKQYPY